ncbi:ribonuclease III [Candidatus Roizmanbacteria bacterium RIFCSPHIGHO2_02_FULL_40_9]|uniref:Ribonuclease 3 n=1 Tax=Candidatus Roizmanbacteria bacterium RIFCSPHIGHO2_02_FULL_40_9 TaxID=1802042 RepID=A0A1F7HBK7_9BACT|nr:MAG: ribonuclease III [Candidatus Roizmanbacteria bacterium RIFCSPHIGHO2_02_FULL_40_9]
MKQISKIPNNNTHTLDIKGIESTIGVTFEDKSLLQKAFIHRSYHNEHPDFMMESNEKLEFLGDSVLSLVTSRYLFNNYPQFQEGDYTDIKAAIVNTQSLCKASKELGLGQYLFLSKGEQENKGRDNSSILADCFEAVLGAVFIEKGLEESSKFVERFLFKDTLDDIISKKLYLPSKNILQEYYQDRFKKLPVYKVLAEKGPEHDKIYEVGVYHENIFLAKGSGKSKKHAEEQAAREALQKLGI